MRIFEVIRRALLPVAIFAAAPAFAQQPEPSIAPGVPVPRPPGNIPGGAAQPMAAAPPAIVSTPTSPNLLIAPGPAARGLFPSSRDAVRAGARRYNDGDKSGAAVALGYAAEQGHPMALWKLGKMFATGDGVQRDSLKAFEHFSRIADEYADEPPDSPNARFVSSAFVSLGAFYLDGIPKSYVKADPARAREMFHYAASYFGDADAQYNLARTYVDGVGGPKDARQAARWLDLAAEKGHPAAQAMLGNLLINGADGVPMQRARGLGLLELAREAADPERDAWIIELHGHAFASTTAQDRDAARIFVERRSKRRQ
ncbi:MAG: tetratricopeptide repeat protein [Beijerinckiaceae bacterium]